MIAGFCIGILPEMDLYKAAGVLEGAAPLVR